MTVSAWPCHGLAVEAPAGYSVLAFVFPIWKTRGWGEAFGSRELTAFSIWKREACWGGCVVRKYPLLFAGVGRRACSAEEGVVWPVLGAAGQAALQPGLAGGGREAVPCCLCTCPQRSLRLQPGGVLEMTYY